MNWQTRFEESYIRIPEAGCWLWLKSVNGQGRPYITIAKNIKVPAARAAWLKYKGEIPKGKLICHICNVAVCVNPAHLYLGTYSSNLLDAMKSGRNFLSKGSNNANSKLTEEQVIYIKQALTTGSTLAALAKQFQVTTSTIWRIKHQIHWNH